MKLDKAIEISTQLTNDTQCRFDPDEHDAIKLGIEAAKEVICLRSSPRTLVRPLLPGETPSDTPG